MNTLKRQESLKELQKYEEYQDCTIKELSLLFKNVKLIKNKLIELTSKIINQHVIDDVLFLIFLNADYLDIINLSCVCKQYNKISNNYSLWHQLINRDFSFILRKNESFNNYYDSYFLIKNFALKSKYGDKQLYEMTHFIIYNYVNKIVSFFEKNRKVRYTTYILNHLFNFIIKMINQQDTINYDLVSNHILTILNAKRKADHDFYVADYQHIKNQLNQLFRRVPYLKQDTMHQINLNML